MDKDEALKLALDGQRHLVEILAENWRVWPAQKAVEQTCLGDVYCSTKGRDLMFGNHEIAVDQDSAVVTKEMWSTMRQTLAAQPAPVQPVAWRAWFDADNGARWLFSLWPEEERLDVEWQPLFTSPPAQPAPVQEPVAWIDCKVQMPPPGVRVFFLHKDYDRVGFDTWCGDDFRWTPSHWMPIPPLTTTPPAAQRQWVGLTDEEYFEIGQRHWVTSTKIELIHAEIEAKLREKNT